MMLALAVVGLLYSALSVVAVLRALRSVPVLEQVAIIDPPVWPRLSVVITARDEESTLERAMEAKLRDDYPNAELIVVDDRSVDATGRIVDAFATRDERVVPVHIHELPEGWLGKVHALDRATAQASGDWLLFSDADVHFAPSTLRRAIAYCEQNELDHLCVFPEVWSSALLLDATMNCFLRLVVVLARPWAVSDPRSRASSGGGNFNLVRRSALERTRGFEWLRLEVVDDAALGQMLKRSGARAEMVNACGLVQLHFYRSLREMLGGMEKNAFAALGRFSVPRFLATLFVLAAVELGPITGLVLGSGPARVVAGIALALAIGGQLLACRWLRRPLLPTLLAPLGMLLFFYGMTRATVLTLARRGILWRSTFYSLEALKKGMRLEVP